VSFPNSTKRTHRLCLRHDQTHVGLQNPYMSRLNRQVYDQTKSEDLSDTRADPIGLCRMFSDQVCRARLVEFGHIAAVSCGLIVCVELPEALTRTFSINRQAIVSATFILQHRHAQVITTHRTVSL